MSVVCAVLSWALLAGAEEPGGFRDRIWGTPWDGNAIRTLPGCDGQGEIVTDVEGVIARVAQPECVGYRVSDDLRVTLILLYPDVKWHRLEHAQVVVAPLVSDWRVWGLTRETADRLAGWLMQVNRLTHLRKVYGDHEPMFFDMGEFFDLPDSVRGLQGYQINFPHEQYAAMKSTLIRQLGPPATQTTDGESAAAGRRTAGEVLEWSGEMTIAVMREYGSRGLSGSFAIVTRRYRDFLRERKRVIAEHKSCVVGDPLLRQRNPSSYPWFLELVESFSWAQDLRRDPTCSLDSKCCVPPY